jgi:hypothetical protein
VVTEIVIIPLALEKMRLRGIPENWVRDAIVSPDDTMSGYGGRRVAQKTRQVGGKSMMLRVVYERANKDYVVVTAYLTSRVERYQRREHGD